MHAVHRKRTRATKYVVGLLACLLVSALPADTSAAAPDLAGLEYFEKQVRPLLVKRGQECHSAEDANGGLALDSRSGFRKGGDSGPAFVPGNPDESRLIEAVRYKNSDLQMPPQGLSRAYVAVLEKWGKLGAPDPRTDILTSGSAATTTGMSIEEGRTFWSFRPVATSEALGAKSESLLYPKDGSSLPAAALLASGTRADWPTPMPNKGLSFQAKHL